MTTSGSKTGPKVGPRLDLRQSQSLVMTPQLQQAIKLLQLNNMELADFLKEELERNPLLEQGDTEREEKTERQEKLEQSQSNLDELQNLKQSRKDSDEGEQIRDRNDTPDEAHENMWGSTESVGKGGNLKFDDNNDFSFEKTLSDEKNLRDHLQEQLFLTFKDEQKRAMGLALIDRLGEEGYLRDDVSLIAKELSCDETMLNDVLISMKQFDPTGVFAKDLKECLSLQLEEKDRLDPAMKLLIENLELLGQHKHQELLKICGVDLEDLRDMITEIRELNPKPASTFDHFVTQTIVPDVIMKPKSKDIADGWTIELNANTLPKVLVNKKYYAEISKMAHSKTEKQFVDEQFQNANWLVRAMDQRAQTILKVASEIVRQQDAFFAYGLQYLKPMTLREIAEVIEMHESTVSRVTTNKYIGTPRGLFEMKFFFTSGIESNDGGISHSSEAVKARIKELIDAEEAQKPLSDDKIAEILNKDGIDIARRTVAKYREAMNIGSSSERKRQKKSIL